MRSRRGDRTVLPWFGVAAYAVATGMLGAIQGLVGAFDQAARIAVFAGCLPGHADADGDGGHGGGQGCGFDRSAQPFAQAQGVGGIGRGQGGDELFAAVAGQQIVAPLQAAIEDAGDGTQAPITFRMAVGVVQPFEVVDVDHQYRQALALARARRWARSSDSSKLRRLPSPVSGSRRASVPVHRAGAGSRPGSARCAAHSRAGSR